MFIPLKNQKQDSLREQNNFSPDKMNVKLFDENNNDLKSMNRAPILQQYDFISKNSLTAQSASNQSSKRPRPAEPGYETHLPHFPKPVYGTSRSFH